MSLLRSQGLDLLRFLALSESEKSKIIFDNSDAWYFKAGEQPVLKLFEQFFEYIDFTLASDEFYEVFQNNSVLNELYSLMELIYYFDAQSGSEQNKFFQRDAIEESPIWKLIRRLAQAVLAAVHEENTVMTVSFEDVICL